MGNYYEGKVALVTGGASGLGRGLCEGLAAAGATVVVSDRDLPGAETLAAKLGSERASAQQLDVTDAEAVGAAIGEIVQRHGRLDLVINNAGIAVAGAVEDVTPELLDRIIGVNLLGTAYVTQAAYARMLEQGSGHVVNIGSMYSLVPGVMQSAYAAAKHGVTGLTLSLAAEASTRGIGVTLICPGYVDTGLFNAGQYAGDLDADSAKAAIPFEFIDIETAVTKILAGVARRRMIVAFPGYVRGAWGLQRLSPDLFRVFNAREFRKVRPPMLPPNAG